MARPNWRSAGAYEDVRSLDAPAFAFEFLRRNDEFLQHHARIVRMTSDQPAHQVELQAFTERWGVRFRAKPGRCTCRRRPLDSKGLAERHCNDEKHRGPGQS